MTYAVQVGQDRDNEKWDGVEEAHEDEPNIANGLLPQEFARGLVHIGPNDILGVGCEADVSSHRMLVLQFLSDEVSVGHRGQTGESIVLGLPTVNLLSIIFNGLLCLLQLGTGEGD